MPVPQHADRSFFDNPVSWVNRKLRKVDGMDTFDWNAEVDILYQKSLLKVTLSSEAESFEMYKKAILSICKRP